MSSTAPQQHQHPPTKAPGNEEPEPAQEESVPSDGKDSKGEQMMEELGRERRQQEQDKR
jgi:hypothetical protein